jgi:hypothetical protein
MKLPEPDSKELPEAYARLVRDTATELVQQAGIAHMKVHGDLPDILNTNFLTNVFVMGTALSIQFMIEASRGQVELDPDVEEKVVAIKKKLGPAIQSIIAEAAGPGWMTVRRTVETGGEPEKPVPATPSGRAMEAANELLMKISEDPDWEMMMSLIVGNLSGHAHKMIRRHRGDEALKRWIDRTENVRVSHIKGAGGAK